MDPLAVGERVEGGPARRPERRRLQGRYVALEPVLPAAHAEALWRAAHDGNVEAPGTWTYMPYGPFRDAGEMSARLEEIASSEDPLFLVVVGPVGPIGMASFLNADVEMRRIELGHIWYGPRARRTEANTEAAYLMLRESFERLGNRRVEWKCDALNERSRAAAIRLGFTFEGVLRHHMVVKGRNRDTAWFSMLEEEWPAAREAFGRWLAAKPDERPPLASLRERG
ncbi:MAG: GNAT family N-acetyltransferase [Actinomycetota bacterium]